jgi:hypothetical protein
LRADHSRIRANPGVVACLRSFPFNDLKANRTETLSQDRYHAGLAGEELVNGHGLAQGDIHAGHPRSGGRECRHL